MWNSGLYYKHIKKVNDASRVISEWRHNLEHHPGGINYDPKGTIYDVYGIGVTYDGCQWQTATLKINKN